jgi:nicotinamide-nucleotide amidase
MTAEIVSVGTELLLGQIADTNAQHLGQLLPQLGVAHVHRQTVGDNLERLTDSLRLALNRADIVITIGGLGPTEDDLTREAIAAALDETLVHDDALEAGLRRLFQERNLPWLDTQLRQAKRPACGRAIENPNGTAPGLICETGEKVIIALPGPKGEFVPMVNGPVADYLRGKGSGEVIHSRLLKIAGLGESVVEDRIRPVLHGTNPTVAPYAKLGEVHLRITAQAPTIDLAEAMIAPVEQRIREVLGDAVFGAGDMTLEQAVIELLEMWGETVAVAESLTGGGLGQRLTTIPGSGEAFVGGVISYQKRVKEELLGVDPSCLNDPEKGPVCAETAEQMATGVRERLGTDYGVSLTGNAGPTSDDGGKPVGLVYVAVATTEGVTVEEHRFRGGRADIRRRSSQAALTLLRQVVLRRGVR